MTAPTLTKIQTTLLTAAAAHPDGLVILPERMSEAAGARHLAQFEDLRLIGSRETGATRPRTSRRQGTVRSACDRHASRRCRTTRRARLAAASATSWPSCSAARAARPSPS